MQDSEWIKWFVNSRSYNSTQEPTKKKCKYFKNLILVTYLKKSLTTLSLTIGINFKYL